MTPERAIPSENPISEKRAGLREKTVSAERVEDAEKPVTLERAVPFETPELKERAERREKPELSERAVPPEKPEPVERAVATEKPAERERTMKTEERAGPATQENATPPTEPFRRYAIRALVDSRYDLQRLRISIGHRRLRILRSWVHELGELEMSDAEIARIITDERINGVEPRQKVTETNIRQIREEMEREAKDEAEKAAKDPTYIRRDTFPQMVADRHTDAVFVLYADIDAKEDQIEEYLEPAASASETGRWLLEQRGIGPVLACGLLSYFDPYKAKHVSSYWKFGGMAPGADRLIREKVIHPRGGPCRICDCARLSVVAVEVRKADGVELEMCECGHPQTEPGMSAQFSTGAKVMLWRVADSFIKQGSPWKKYYDEAKPEYLKQFMEQYPKKAGQKDHAHKAAIRVMIKEFLKELYIHQRREAGLPVDPPYSARFHPEVP